MANGSDLDDDTHVKMCANIEAVGQMVQDLWLAFLVQSKDADGLLEGYLEGIQGRDERPIIHPGTSDDAEFLRDVTRRAHQKLLFRVQELARTYYQLRDAGKLPK